MAVGRMIVFLAVVAGGLGAAARFAVDGAVKARIDSDFPWATLAINVTGSLLLGVLSGLVIAGSAPDGLRAVLGTGFCGGYTTFSTASFETLRLAQRGAAGRAALYVAASVGLSIAAAALGLLLAR